MVQQTYLQHAHHVDSYSIKLCHPSSTSTPYAPYANIGSEEGSNLVLKVTESSHFNSSECAFVSQLEKPDHSKGTTINDLEGMVEIRKRI